MPAPTNTFKKSLAAGETLFGCWLSIAEGCTAEILGNAGFDWLLIDGEHSPNDIRSIRDQVIALAKSDSHPIVRVPIGETWIIKQVLDLGVQTILVPIVETEEQARELVRACRYPPEGIRGVGYGVSRAGGFGQYIKYSVEDDDINQTTTTMLLTKVLDKHKVAMSADIQTKDHNDWLNQLDEEVKQPLKEDDDEALLSSL